MKTYWENQVMARKLEFDKDEALQKAMLLFWEKGYEATSMKDLVQAMAINRFSIYNTFGDKKVLLLMSLKHYRDHVLAKLIAPLKADLPAEICLENYFDRMSKQLSSASGRLGCFIQKTGQSHISSEPEVADLLQSMLGDLRSALLDVLARVRKEQAFKIAYEDETMADFILCQLQGMIVLRRSGKKLALVERQIDLLKTTVMSW